MATEKGSSKARFCVVPQSTLAVFRQRSGDEAIHAQTKFDDDLISALENMVQTARAGRLEGEAALELRALAW